MFATSGLVEARRTTCRPGGWIQDKSRNEPYTSEIGPDNTGERGPANAHPDKSDWPTVPGVAALPCLDCLTSRSTETKPSVTIFTDFRENQLPVRVSLVSGESIYAGNTQSHFGVSAAEPSPARLGRRRRRRGERREGTLCEAARCGICGARNHHPGAHSLARALPLA